MNKLTYRQAYDKIIQAYFRGEILPFDERFCFCGTLCDNKVTWAHDSYHGVHNDFGNYLGVEYVRMEKALLNPILAVSEQDEVYEDALFTGMCAALDVLKEIHRSRGEDVDGLEVPAFTKRQLQKA